MENICREVGYEIEMVELPWAALVAPLSQGVGQRLVVGEDHEVQCFQHMIEMPDSFVDSEQLSVVGALFLLRRTHFLREETFQDGGLPGAAGKPGGQQIGLAAGVSPYPRPCSRGM
jgi:hypothetical protein